MAKLRVLIASESPLYRRSLSRMIADETHEVIQAQAGDEVVAYLKATDVDFCFLQDHLLDGSGLEICEQYSGDSVPIVIFSQDVTVETQALDKGASGFLKLPCRSQAVLDFIRGYNGDGDVGIAPEPEPSDVEADDDGASSKAGSDLSSGEQAKDQNRGDKLILLVDDSQLIHSYVGGVIREAGFGLAEAYNGGEGFQKALESLPDLIVSDIDMPRVNGFDMCRRIKQTEETQRIPVLFLSARGTGIDIDTGFDVGANGYLTKPIDENELITRIEIILGAGEQTGEQKREKVLVVEDSMVQRNLIVQGLSQQGFEVISGINGEEGLELALEQMPDLVITDSEMPVMNGRDMARALKSHDNMKDIPVVMLTAADSKLDRVKGEHAGVSAYLTKPFVPDKVVVIAEKLIGERRLVSSTV